MPFSQRCVFTADQNVRKNKKNAAVRAPPLPRAPDDAPDDSLFLRAQQALADAALDQQNLMPNRGSTEQPPLEKVTASRKYCVTKLSAVRRPHPHPRPPTLFTQGWPLKLMQEKSFRDNCGVSIHQRFHVTWV